MLQNLSEQLIIITALLWAGMIFGISFLESWVKFRAPTLTKLVALDVGRTVFRAFHKTQYGLVIILLILCMMAHLSLWNWLIMLLILLILVWQGWWLLPSLNRRVDMLLANQLPPTSYVHLTYGILEVIKVGLLFYFALRLMMMKLGL